jgi:hypothetical protein
MRIGGTSVMGRLNKALRLGFLCLLFGVGIAPQALAAESPYQLNAEASLIGGCALPGKGVDPIPDPGCPGGTHPPKKFEKPTAVAVDQFGNEYVASFGTKEDGSEGRIDIFDPDGNFITEILDPSGPQALAIDSKGNLYVTSRRPSFPHEVARYSPTGEYDPEVGKIQYGARTVIADTEGQSRYGIAVDLSNDRLFVNHGFSLSEYESFEEGNELLDTYTPAGLKSGYSLAIDTERRRIYSSSCPGGNIEECWVIVLNADDPEEQIAEVTGDETPEGEFFSGKGWISVAVDETDGSLFVGDLEITDDVHKFNADYEYLSTTEFAEFKGAFPPVQIAVSNAPEGTTNYRFFYVPAQPTSGVGHAWAFEPPGIGAPEVESVSVGNIGETEAELQAQIEPNGGVTTYSFEYTTQQAFEEKGFEGAAVAGQGTLAANRQEADVFVPVAGLSPGTAYRFRVFAENEVDSDEKEGTFTTYDDAPVLTTPCPNEALRTAFSANLPDCRAYELVTPPDTNGRPPKGIGFIDPRFTTLEVSPAGNAVSFVTEGGTLPGSGGTGSLNGDLYRAERGTSGWGSVSAGPTGAETTSAKQGSTSPDQGYAFWAATQEGSAVIEGESTTYVHYPDGHSELVGRGSLGIDPRVLGKWITENGTHIIFETWEINSKPPIQLEPNAPPTGTDTVYDRIKNPGTGAEETKVVSLLPGDATPAAGQDADYIGASFDGEGIAFSIGSTLYLRVNNEETFEAGTGVTFAGVAEGGSRIFYMEGGDLKALDTASEEEIAFTNLGNVTPVNVSKDGSRAYFVSTSALGDENPNGDLPVAGQRNLYLSEEGAISFVATVTARDVEGQVNPKNGAKVDGLGLWTIAVRSGELSLDPSRLNPDGSVMLFQSRANLDGYDPEGVPQVYRYDHTGERLHCLSCIPTKGKAGEGASIQSYEAVQGEPEPFSSFGFVPGLTPDGNRAFFESTEALVSRDSNGVRDVYEWEEAGIGSCTTAGGCIYLITSGQSAKDNYLYGHSQSGDDVFFTTSDVLSGFDAGDTLSIYDARVGGGFPEPTEEVCEGEGCRPTLTPPPPMTEAAKPSLGADDQVRPQRSKKCPKGKRKVKRGGKVVCVKKKKQGKKAGKNKKGARR